MKKNQGAAPFPPEDLEKILIIKPSSLGDIVHGLQVAQSLKVQRPNSELTWIARDCFAPLVWACSSVDRCWMYHRHGGWSAWRQLLKTIRSERFDAVLDLQGLARSGLMTLVARSDEKIGRSDAREGSRWCYHRRMPLPLGGRESHALEILVEVLPLLGCAPELSWPLRFNPMAVRALSEAVLAKHRIVLFPESRRPEKEWPFFAVLAEHLCKTFPEASLIWSGQGKAVRPPSVSANIINLSGRLPVEGLLPLIANASLVIANDSAPVHLAAALGTPVLALFGPTDPKRYGPYPLTRSSHHFLQAPGGKLDQLSVEPVIAKVRAVMVKIMKGEPQ